MKRTEMEKKEFDAGCVGGRGWKKEKRASPHTPG